jgi:hypothetical protein
MIRPLSLFMFIVLTSFFVFRHAKHVYNELPDLPRVKKLRAVSLTYAVIKDHFCWRDISVAIAVRLICSSALGS